MKKTTKYSLLIFASAMVLPFMCICFGGAAYFFFTLKNIFGAIILAALGAIVFTFKSPLEKLRLEARNEQKYDDYGRVKISNQYERMSAREQAEIDRINQLEMERTLPSSVVRSMTHEGSKDPVADMENLIGLQTVKEKMEEMAARMEFDQESGIKSTDSCMHMCFFGPPGTGKTTCARIMTGFLYKYGYIRENRLIETDGNFLADSMNASSKTELLIQKSYGGVLFIDEAYSLLNNPTGREAISTMIKQMEDNKEKFILILAGYENEMRKLIQSNPGFLSRVKEYFYFQSYSVPELTQMFEKMAKEIGFTISPAAKGAFIDLITSLKDGYHFGNARTVRNILDKSKDRHSLNFKRGIVKERFELDARDIYYEEIQI